MAKQPVKSKSKNKTKQKKNRDIIKEYSAQLSALSKGNLIYVWEEIEF